MEKIEYLKNIRELCRQILNSEDLKEIEAKVHTLSQIKTDFMHKLSGYERVRSCLNFDANIEIIKWEHNEGFDDDGDGEITDDLVFKVDDIQVELYTELNPDWRGKLFIDFRINDVVYQKQKEGRFNIDDISLLKLIKKVNLGEIENKFVKFLHNFLNSFDEYFEIEEIENIEEIEDIEIFE